MHVLDLVIAIPAVFLGNKMASYRWKPCNSTLAKEMVGIDFI